MMADLQEISEGWQQLVDDLLGEMLEWQEQHPEATLLEIEQEIAARMVELRARLLQDIAMWRQQTDAGQNDDQTKRGATDEETQS
jgi:hypothetical protein